MTTKIKKYKLCRRLGAAVFPQCESVNLKPKQKDRKHPSQMTEYGSQMLEKQRVRFSYGVRERQFGRYVELASKKQGVNPAEELYRLLESRLDNVVFRFGLAPTRSAARQMVGHGHVTVNGERVTIPSYAIKKDDVVAIRANSRGRKMFEGLSDKMKEYKAPVWLTYDESKNIGKVIASPTMEAHTGLPMNITSVIEFYSR